MRPDWFASITELRGMTVFKSDSCVSSCRWGSVEKGEHV